MASLKTKHQEFVVTRLARFDSPSEVRDALRERFSVEASLDQIVYYNPETVNGRDGLAEKWKDLFYETRKKYLEDTSSIPAAHKAFRIRELAEGARDAKEMGNYPMMADLYEQIAKEMGGKYEKGADGTADDPIHTVGMSVDEWREQAQERRRQAEDTMEQFEDDEESNEDESEVDGGN